MRMLSALSSRQANQCRDDVGPGSKERYDGREAARAPQGLC